MKQEIKMAQFNSKEEEEKKQYIFREKDDDWKEFMDEMRSQIRDLKRFGVDESNAFQNSIVFVAITRALELEDLYVDRKQPTNYYHECRTQAIKSVRAKLLTKPTVSDRVVMGLAKLLFVDDPAPVKKENDEDIAYLNWMLNPENTSQKQADIFAMAGQNKRLQEAVIFKTEECYRAILSGLPLASQKNIQNNVRKELVHLRLWYEFFEWVEIQFNHINNLIERLFPADNDYEHLLRVMGPNFITHSHFIYKRLWPQNSCSSWHECLYFTFISPLFSGGYAENMEINVMSYIYRTVQENFIAFNRYLGRRALISREAYIKNFNDFGNTSARFRDKINSYVDSEEKRLKEQKENKNNQEVQPILIDDDLKTERNPGSAYSQLTGRPIIPAGIKKPPSQKYGGKQQCTCQSVPKHWCRK